MVENSEDIKLASVVQPYVYKILEGKTKIIPYQLGTSFEAYLLKNLKDKLEKKCTNIGYIESVDMITEYEHGKLPAGNFTGNVIYNVKFKAKIYIPIPDTSIVCKFKMARRFRCYAYNGPLFIIIKAKDMNEKFSYDSKGNLMYDNKIITEDDYLVVKILTKHMNMGNTYIIIMAILEGLANDNQLKYFSSNNEDNINNIIINM
jgi:DNA-directed RNA polymerase subunit E'/Rpb7